MAARKKVVKKQEPDVLIQPGKINFMYHLRDTFGCGHYRGILPAIMLTSLMNPMARVEATTTDRIFPHPSMYNNVHFAILQRLDGEHFYNVTLSLKRVLSPQTKLVYDIDDDLINIPKWNFASKYFTKDKVDYVKKIISEVDFVTTSTPQLAKLYGKYNKNTVIIPNRLSKVMWGEPTFTDWNHEKPRILYAGSDNHFDLDSKKNHGDFSLTLSKFIEKTRNDYEWVFIGGMPGYLREKNYPEIKRIGWHSFFYYIMFMRTAQPDLMIAPLVDCVFNRGKSNVKAMESIAAGAPLLATDIVPYHGLGRLSKSDAEMIGHIEEIANDVDKRRELWEQQHTLIRPELFYEENDNTLKNVNTHLIAGFNMEVKTAEYYESMHLTQQAVQTK